MGGRQQRGAALLMVMVVLAMLAAGMAWLVEDGRRQVDEVRLLHQRVQARAMEQAGLAYAEQALRDPAWRLSPLFWQALRGQPLNYDFGAGQAQLRVRDQHTCFNVNALLGADGERAERQLRYLLGDDMAAERLVDALADWLDADSDTRLQGAESAQYLRQQPPRLAANQPMLDTSELNLLLEPDASRQGPLSDVVCLAAGDRLAPERQCAWAGAFAAAGGVIRRALFALVAQPHHQRAAGVGVCGCRCLASGVGGGG